MYCTSLPLSQFSRSPHPWKNAARRGGDAHAHTVQLLMNVIAVEGGDRERGRCEHVAYSLGGEMTVIGKSEWEEEEEEENAMRL